jgi:hypothetical protein
MRNVFTMSLLAALALAACTEAAYTEADGEWAGEDGQFGASEEPSQEGPDVRPGLNAIERCAAFEDELGDDRIDADVAALLDGENIKLTLAHADHPSRACAGFCSNAWLFGVELPLNQQGSFDLESNEVIGNFTLPMPHDGQCSCLSGHGLTRGSVELVAISPDVVCGWIVEDSLLDVQGGFAAPVLDLN